MFFYIITWTVIYFILILLLHNLYLFFQKNLTTTKTKDYYNFPNKEYNKINNILNSDIKLPEKKVKNNDDTSTNSKLTTFSNIDFSLTSNEQYNNDTKIFPNYDVNLTTKNVETALEKDNTFDLDKFNSQFENNNMKGELEEFLNKLNN
tara:strand:- start:238 stop:684 length:447 start_codon:yes stop_codon:yes gene_type:complete